MSIEVRNITKTFGGYTALRDVSLHVPSGQLVALLGPSGSGKTTLLRIIAGLETADPGSGKILFHDEDVAARHARHRQVGFVFQHYALFKHMTVFQNIAFGLTVRPRATRPSRQVIRWKVGQLLSLIQLENLADRYPSQLSGGQRQRVALARALAVEPKVLLLDEPFGSLDAQVRQELRHWLRRLHDELHVTSLFVTHDQEEAMEVSDSLAVMNQGNIEQIGTPDDVFHRPATEFVRSFLSHVNLFHGRLSRMSGGSRSAEPANLEVRTAKMDDTCVRTRIRRVESAGTTVRLELCAQQDPPVQMIMSSQEFERLHLAVGKDVYVRPQDIRLFVNDYSI